MPKSVANAYLAGEAESLQFFPSDYRDPAARRHAVVKAAARRCDPKLIAALQAQNACFAPSAERDRQLRALASGNAAAVLTGQQVGLFLGPLYSVYKAASAVATAQQLERESGVPVVPVFWLQTEDHDFVEIASARFPGPDQTVQQIVVPDGDPGLSARRSVAARTLGGGVDDALRRAADLCSGLPDGPAVEALLRRHYTAEKRWGEAFAGLLAELFADEGLLIFDPRTAEVAPLAAELHRRSLAGIGETTQLLQARSRALDAAGFAVQIVPRSACSLSFFHPDGPCAGRFRVMSAASGFSLSGDPRAFDEGELQRALVETPLAFSTSALLRPLLQDQLFPTAATVGGPGEIAYFAQLAPLYRWIGLPMPLIVPRGRFAVVDQRIAACLDQWGLAAGDLARSDRELAAQLVGGDAGLLSPEALRARLLVPFADELRRITAPLIGRDASAEKAIDKTETHIGEVVEKLARRLQSAWLQADQRQVAKISRARSWLFPEGAPQERVFSWPYFAARFGVEAFKRAIFEAFEPFSPQVRELRLR